MNKATLCGNVGGDPEIKRLTNGDQICNFSIATSDRWTDKQSGEKREKVEWHRVTVFNQPLIPVFEKFVRKGSKILIEGVIRTRKWQDQAGADRYSTEIVLEPFKSTLELLGDPKGATQVADETGYHEADNAQQQRTTQTKKAAAKPAPQDYSDGLDDEIPF